MKNSSLILILATSLSVASCHKTSQTVDSDSVPAIDVSRVFTDSLTLYKDYPGSLMADRTIDVVARVNGTIITKNYEGGEFVRQGQVLFTIDPTTYRNAVQEAEASLQQARSENEYAEQHYEAVAKALESNAVSKMEVAEALSSRDQSRAAIRNAEAQLSTARENLSYCTVVAPCDGHITTNAISRGAYVAGEGSPVTLATVYDDAVILADFSIEDASFQRMFLNPNNRDKINYAAVPVVFSEKLPHEYTADLTYLAPDVNGTTGTMEIHGSIENKYNELKAGMYVTVKLPYKVDPQAMVVRAASISTDQLGKYVYVVNDSNKVVYTPIEVGDAVNDSLRIVTSGLKPGDRYVTSAMLKVHDGMEIKPVEANSKK